MSYRDLLLAVVTYPDVTPTRAIACATALARRFGGSLTALALEVKIKAPRNALANALVGIDDIAREEEARSAAQAAKTARSFTAAAAKEGLPASALVERVPLHEEAERITFHARTRDLCLLAIGPAVLADVSIAEAVLFGSGRPLAIFAEDGEPVAGDRFERAVIAWDGSRAASRAVADAIPALQRADEVRILTVTGDKPGVGAGAAEDLRRHLRTHGVSAKLDEVAAAGEPIGRVLSTYVAAHGVDLLVMGGFGHSRAREFVLGGATASMIDAPPCPVLMSH